MPRLSASARLIGEFMQITSSVASAHSGHSIAPASASTEKSAPARSSESYLTLSDISMLEYVTGTNTLADALKNPHAQALAVSIGTKRENGYFTGDYSQFYVPAQLTPSDAKMVESMTGTTSIIDAQFAGNEGVNDLMITVGLDRKYGLPGDLTETYLNQMISFDQLQTLRFGGLGISVPIDTLRQALAFLEQSKEPNHTNIVT